MGTTQGISYCSYPYFKLAKHHISYFIIIFYVFSSIKSMNRREEQHMRGGGWGAVGTGGKGEVVGKGLRG
jgi:hypothetical protein